MLLEVKRLEVHYGGIRAVKGIDLAVGAGAFGQHVRDPGLVGRPG